MQPKEVWHYLVQMNSLKIRCGSVEAESLRKALYRHKNAFDKEMALLYTDPSEMEESHLSMTYENGVAHFKLTDVKRKGANSYELILDDEEIRADLDCTETEEDHKD